MRRFLTFMMLLVLLAGCRRSIGGPEAGAASSQTAIQQFLNAANAGDIQAMSAVFGDEQSPLRDRVSREEVERRMLIMTCHLKHDAQQIGTAQSGQNGRTQHRVELTQGTKQASPVFVTTKNSRTGRWFVADFDLPAVRDFCGVARRPSIPPPAPASR